MSTAPNPLMRMVLEAQDNGYSNDEIVSHLADKPDTAAKIQEAQSAGYSPDDIVSHLAALPTQPPPEIPGFIKLLRGKHGGEPFNPPDWLMPAATLASLGEGALIGGPARALIGFGASGLAGYGTHRVAKALGASEPMADALGAGAGLLTGAGAAKIGMMPEALPEGMESALDILPGSPGSKISKYLRVVHGGNVTPESEPLPSNVIRMPGRVPVGTPPYLQATDELAGFQPRVAGEPFSPGQPYYTRAADFDPNGPISGPDGSQPRRIDIDLPIPTTNIATGQPTTWRGSTSLFGNAIPPVNKGPVTWSGGSVPIQPIEPMNPQGESGGTSASVPNAYKDMTRMQKNNALHAIAQELDLPGSPSGSNKGANAAIAKAGSDNKFPDSVSKWSDEQMERMWNFLRIHRRVPNPGELK
jgi:hypothetical protein